jgi:hypothetical protein
MSYATVRQAIIDKCCLTATYDQKIRHFSPHAIGRDNNGDENVIAFQYGGQSRKGLPPGGQWRCFHVSAISGVQRNKDPWHTGHDHGRPKRCVTRIDVQAH